ncbi:MAG: hypothetical protein ACPGOV_00925 [Magnetovibrionaceae bacterium]
MIELTSLLGAALVIGLIVAWTLILGAPPAPSSAHQRKGLIGALPAEIKGEIWDLGSGFGGLARTLAEAYPQNPVIGREASPLPWLVSWCLNRLKPVRAGNLAYQFGPAEAADLTRAGLVTLYIGGKATARVAEQLEGRLEAGTLVVSLFFAIRSWTPEQVLVLDDAQASRLYLYRIGGP